uniref:ADP-ribosylation factor-like 5B n=1 Tax=Mus musculus TaxID=10090 RepID=A0A0A6YWH0_MOUSE
MGLIFAKLWSLFCNQEHRYHQQYITERHNNMVFP